MNHILPTFLFFFFQISLNAQPAFDWVKKHNSISNQGGAYGEHILDRYGNSYNFGLFASTVDFDPGPGNFYLTSASPSTDAFISKFNPQGDLIWAIRIGGTGEDKAASMGVDMNGDLLITGSFQLTVDFDPGAGVSNLTGDSLGDAFILKLDSAGNFIYAKSFGGVNGNENPSVQIDPFNQIYLYGAFQYTVDFDPGPAAAYVTATGNMNNADAYILKLDSNANFLWVKTFGGNGADFISALKISNTGNLYLTGTFSDTADLDPGPGVYTLVSQPFWSDCFIEKLNSNGDFLWVKNYTGTLGRQTCDIDLDKQNNIYITGYFEDSIDVDPGLATFYLTTGPITSNAYITKSDSNANFLWGKSFKGYSSFGYSLCLDSNANVFIAGAFMDTCDFDPGPALYNIATNNYSLESYICKLNTNGNFQWAVNIAGITQSAQSVPWSVNADIAGNIYLAGYYDGTFDFDPGAGSFTMTSMGIWHDYFLLKLNKDHPARVDEIEALEGIFVYPNPTTGTTNLFMKESMQNATLCLTNMQGQILFEQKNIAGKNTKLDLSQFETGIYLLKIRDGNRVSTSKLLKY